LARSGGWQRRLENFREIGFCGTASGVRGLAIRRFLTHLLPSGFHRIRHYGLFASALRARNIERIRNLLTKPETAGEREPPNAEPDALTPAFAPRCPCYGGRMIVIETFEGADGRRNRGAALSSSRIFAASM
jgi:Putative transposase